MPYYLKHYFDPDFDFHKLKPKELESGKIDFYDLGYVQNVIQDQVLAEWVEIDDNDLKVLNPAYVTNKPKPLPAGLNTKVNPENPRQLQSAINGYVFYLNGVINVKEILNVRSNIDSRTGNIVFVGDIIVHGSVRTGFKIKGRNVRIRENVDGGEVKAIASLLVDGGATGVKKSVLSANKDLSVSYCDNARLMATQNMKIETNCMHSEVYAGSRLLVKGNLIGGLAYCGGIIFVSGALGSANTETKIFLGYDPFLLYDAEQLERRINETEDLVSYYGEEASREGEYKEIYLTKLAGAQKKLSIYRRQKEKLLEKLNSSEEYYKSRLMVPGTIMPGTAVNIGPNYMLVEERLEDVCLICRGSQIKVTSPAMKR